jgi:raffinose/stachyose/melibiose transport system substrate-binding protein
MTAQEEMGYVIDDKMSGDGTNNILNPDLQALVMGQKTSQQVAQDYETWVAANDPARQKKAK